MEYKIRRGKIEDLKKIISLTKRAYEVPYKEGGLITKSGEPKNVEEIFKNKGFFVLIAEHNNRIIGAIRYMILEDNNLYIYKLVVSKKYRNKGIAKSLIDEVEKIAKKKKFKKLLLDCAKEKSLPEYYKKLGFAVDRIKKHGNHHDVYMSKKVYE